MRTYGELFRTPEFSPFFLTVSVQIAAMTVSQLALGTLIYEVTDSPLLSSLAMFGPSLAQGIGALTLLSAADRLPPRVTLVGLALLASIGTAAQAVPGLPVWGVFALLMVLGLLGSLNGGVRYGLLNELLTDEGYLLGRSVVNMSVGVTHICGFALGGVLVAFLTPRGTLLVGCALYLVAAVVARLGLTRRPPRAAGRPSVAETWRNTAVLWSSKPRRHVYLALWVPNGLIVGCESLFVPYAPGHAGLLFACAAVGMLAGDTLIGRFVSRRWKNQLSIPLRLLLAVPYLIFFLHPGPPLAVTAVVLASIGYSASLLLQERLMAVTPPELSGQALGLDSSGTLGMQGVGAVLAGAVAQFTSPATAMGIMAIASVAVTVALIPALRAPLPRRDADVLGARSTGE
ncbi:putative MFS family arabinose efflux permease [Actinoalloteichus hoggarensis]|uniref:Major Facilitator Superfamily protein n=1 Tax=Actinoalloteichus hoggarensis TaxID=1470176 RepID=A0A221W6S7_9PSEU|nr:MFS transporter [Actinoalloteichus hoggarensis]ASO21087.1 Major Facilitator Superfamily protein [Actinoalloteichus hoggarensis]MBB5921017.1 putative MFS family arabinose efflux permease [Actinoalloteichus hoggarensis]